MNGQPPASACPTVFKWNVVFVSGCNLRCGYCTTGHGEYGQGGGVMDDRTSARLAGWIAGSMKREPRETLVGFAGGETFLHYDRFLAFADQLTARCREQGGVARISVVTNGVLLNPDRLQQLAERRIGLAFSIDGPETVHDAYRRDATGQGSFQAAFRNWVRCRNLELRRNDPGRCSVHSVFGPHSGSVREVSEFWIRQGQPLVNLAIMNHPRFAKTIAPEVVDQARAACVEGLREWALDQAARCTPGNFLERYRGPAVIYKGWQRLLFERGLPLCTPGRGILASDHLGNLYPCEAYLGTARWRIGDVWNGLEPERLEAFLAECRKAEKICAACPTEPTCDKPCLGLSANTTPVENVLEGCPLSKSLTRLVQDSFDRLMQWDAGARKELPQ